MKVYYQGGTYWAGTPSILANEKNMLSLSFNDWDDYGIGTTVNAVLYLNGKNTLEFRLKILIENDQNSSVKLNELLKKGWNGFFPIPDQNYVSVPSDIYFYSALLGKLNETEVIEVLKVIKDAGYLKNIEQDQEAIKLIEHPDFNTSPLREGGARKSFSDGWTLFAHQDSKIDDFTLYARKRNGLPEPIKFKFNSNILPYDINILIGPNGIGKSYTLKSLVEYWLGIGSGDQQTLKKDNYKPFDQPPNISKLILISYSPFEEFELDLSNTTLRDKDAYKYFGFRQLRRTEGGTSKIGISRNLPSKDSIESILKAFSDDFKFGFMPKWVNKIDSILAVLQPAIDFDYLAVELLTDISNVVIESQLPHYFITIKEKKYIRLDDKIFHLFEEWDIRIDYHINLESGVLFIKDEDTVDLSSGQRLFCYIVLNVVGQIKADSLIVIDEPELFLHPTLEIEFISLLKKVLKAFNSKAILATHSLAIAREVPSNCAHVYRKHEGNMKIQHPPFEIFGGDMQRISSYVFGDNAISKPFDNWIDEKLKETRNPNLLLQMLGKEVNEELIIKILNSGHSDGE